MEQQNKQFLKPKRSETYIEHKEKVDRKLPTLSELLKETRGLKKSIQLPILPELSEERSKKLPILPESSEERSKKLPILPESVQEKDCSKKQCKKADRFTDKEKQRIFELYIELGNQWEKIRVLLKKEGFPERSKKSIQNQYYSLRRKIEKYVQNDKLYEGFSDEEKQKLFELYEKLQNDQCYIHFTDEEKQKLLELYKKLQNDRRHIHFTEKENQKLLELYVEFGNQWEKISVLLNEEGFPERSKGSIQSQYYYLLRKKEATPIRDKKEDINYFKYYQSILQMNIHSTELYNQPTQQNGMYEITGIQPLGTQNQPIQQVHIQKTQQQLSNSLHEVMEEIDIEINREKVTMSQETSNTAQYDLLDNVRNAMEEVEEEYDCYKGGFLHDYDYEAMGH